MLDHLPGTEVIIEVAEIPALLWISDPRRDGLRMDWADHFLRVKLERE
jgi:hypothetical protein